MVWSNDAAGAFPIGSMSFTKVAYITWFYNAKWIIRMRVATFWPFKFRAKMSTVEGRV